jgi:hypothetical protein
MSMRVGLDFGGVIVRHRDAVQGEDTGLKDDDGTQVVNLGAFEAVNQLVSASNGCVWIVSKAGPKMQARTLAWLDKVAFYARTGLKAEHVKFCLEREGKKAICRDLKLSHFVDDRIHVMQILRHTVPHLYLFGPRENAGLCPHWANFVQNWNQVVALMVGPNQVAVQLDAAADDRPEADDRS